MTPNSGTTPPKTGSGASDAAAEISLSIIIPAYNEAARIPATLPQILDYARTLGPSCEIIIVDDGSTDETVEFVKRIAWEIENVRLLRHKVNAGKGSAVRNGVLHARGQCVLFTDADLSAPIVDAQRLLDLLQSGYDVAVGSRALRPDWIGVHQSGFREAAGNLFNFLVRACTGLPFRDTQCGFKAFRRQAAQAIFARQLVSGFGFDVEVLYLARKYGFRAIEVPVHWDHSAASKVHPLSDGLHMFCDLLAIRRNDWRGKYKGDDT